MVTYHPDLTNIGGVLRELHPILESSERCSKAMKNVPMLAFRKPKSLTDYLVRAKVNRSLGKGSQRKTVKCNSKRCVVCTNMDEKDRFVCNGTDRKYSINYNLNCNSSNVVTLLPVRHVAYNM